MSDQISGKIQLEIDDKADKSSSLFMLVRNNRDGQEINYPR